MQDHVFQRKKIMQRKDNKQTNDKNTIFGRIGWSSMTYKTGGLWTIWNNFSPASKTTKGIRYFPSVIKEHGYITC